MNTLEIILAIISIFSFLLAVYSFVRTEIKKANEKANIEILKSKLNSLYQHLAGLYYGVDAIVQIPKQHNTVTTQELQNYARLLRVQILSEMEVIAKSRNKLNSWRFGQMIKSENLEDYPAKKNLDAAQAEENEDVKPDPHNP